jgi:S-adenosylmethionine-diacylglycerol 3-amino-3-carboxypropyl transferase
MQTVGPVEGGEISRRRSKQLVNAAVKRNKLMSKAGLTERAFTFAFTGLVYPQIWEDPVVDMEAMEIQPGNRIITIASGGCNALSYLTADPAEIVAVDLNTAHIALNRMKLTAVRHLPDYASFFKFFGVARGRENTKLFDTYIRPHLDAETDGYWNGRTLRGRRRIDVFKRGFYGYGLLGRFISTGHKLSKLLGSDPSRLMKARTREEQREIYERDLAPLLKKPIVRMMLDQRSSLFGLGIPPAQYDALAEGRPMNVVIEERLRRLATGFDLKDNYFAWQAFNRGYDETGKGPLPIYLQERHYNEIRERASRIKVQNTLYTEYLKTEPDASFDRYILLDAQDWMTDDVLTELWSEITRTARPGARVIFRTAGKDTILPGRIPDAILNRWHYAAERSVELGEKDRSAIYGGFHLYMLKGPGA